METNLKVTKVSLDEMMTRPEKEYNPAIWEAKVKRMFTYPKIQFYVIEKDNVFQYARFYASYIADGIYFFSEWNAFMASLTDRGFCAVNIKEDGTVVKTLFRDASGKEGYVSNDKHNRDLFRKNLTPRNIMVTNCL
jgi:hypothetical protein